MLNEIVKLSEILPQDNILQMRRNDGSKTTLVPIPEAKNKESFIRNENRKKWLQKIPMSVFPNDEEKAVEWIFNMLGKNTKMSLLYQ